MYLGIFPIVATFVILGFFFLLFPMGNISESDYVPIGVVIYLGMLLGWGFVYLTSEGWGSKETITDNKLRKKIILIAISISAILTIFIVVFFGSYNSFAEIVSEWSTLFFVWLIFLAISWAVMDLGIWITKRKNK